MSGLGDAAPQGEGRTFYALSEEERILSSPIVVRGHTSINAAVPHPPSASQVPASPTSSTVLVVERPPRKRGKIPKPTTDLLKDWLHRHSDHPYPTEDEKKQLCAATGLSMSQLSNWMINARRRILAPVQRSRAAADSGVQPTRSIVLTDLDEAANSDRDSDEVNNE
ncbi:homeobox KN domain-containing protein [Lactarius quietus]|nr:homeobox KN domain-containing protein [Lactarius quietus]